MTPEQTEALIDEIFGGSAVHWLCDRGDPRWSPALQEAWAHRQQIKELAKQVTDAIHARDAALAQRDELLAACEAEERVDTHWRDCEECSDDGECCEAQSVLVDEAERLRRAAIEKARKP